MTEKWRVETYGRDCLGNISGYRVVRFHGLRTEFAGNFPVDIYIAGSFDLAEHRALRLCRALNLPDESHHTKLERRYLLELNRRERH